MTPKELQILEDLPQFPRLAKAPKEELLIGKNDPKNGNEDHWWISYGVIHLSGYYALPAMLSAFVIECQKQGYVTDENALLSQKNGYTK